MRKLEQVVEHYLNAIARHDDAVKAYAADANWDVIVATEEEVSKSEADLLAAAGVDGTPTYVRFGLPPSSGRSFDYSNDTFEDGVAVYDAFRCGRYVVVPTRCISTSYVPWAAVQEVPLYELAGERVGTTSDGTPAIRVSTCHRMWRQCVFVGEVGGDDRPSRCQCGRPLEPLDACRLNIRYIEDGVPREAANVAVLESLYDSWCRDCNLRWWQHEEMGQDGGDGWWYIGGCDRDEWYRNVDAQGPIADTPNTGVEEQPVL